MYSPHSSESRSRGAGTRASLGNAQAQALPQPQVPGAARTPGRQGWGGHCIQGACCARRGVVGEEPGGRVKLTATAAQPQSLQGTLRLRGERARSPAAGALGGTGSSPLRLMTTAELWHGARPPPTALLSLAAPARGRYPAEMPSLGALGLVCTAEASGGDGPSGLSLTSPGMGRDAAQGPVLRLRQRPSCPPCPALVQCPCHPQPPPRVCRPWAAHPVAVERLPWGKATLGASRGTASSQRTSRKRRKLPCPAFPALPHTRVCTRGSACDRRCKCPSGSSHALFPGIRSPSFRLRMARVLACSAR